jgi:signal transduction histidine kinase/CheY-like chemotaxis protein
MSNLRLPVIAPTSADLRLFSVLMVLHIGLILAILPWAHEPGIADPRISSISSGAVLLAEFCTALLLGALYLASGHPPLLIMTCAYFYSSLMAALHAATFAGAVFATPLFGNEQTVSWLYLAWRAGTPGVLLAAIFLETAIRGATPAKLRTLRLVGGLVAILLSCALIVALAAQDIGVQLMSDTGRWTGLNHAIIAASVLMCVAGIIRIWTGRAFNQTLYLWLALVLMAMAIGSTLGNMGGGRYTVGWHASRAHFVISAYLLLAFLMNELSDQRRRSSFTLVAAYGGALAAMLAAIFLRWFMDPWIGLSMPPYITLFTATAVAVWVGGWAPAVLSTLLGYVISSILFAESINHLTLNEGTAILQFGVFAACCALIIALGETMRRARDRYRASESTLQERAAELQRANSNKSQFLAMLAHELRNPLAPLRTGLAVLHLSPDKMTARQTREMMERQIGSMTRLIDDLLDVSRIDRGKLELYPERLAVDTAVRSAIETAMPGIEAKGHELAVHHARQPLFIDADPVRFGQVLTNLLNNAAKFTPPGGRIELGMRAENGQAVITVADSGIGLAPEHLQTVFDLFVQVDSNRTAGGLGLGLTLVRSIVELHGGSVEAHSAGAGQGTVFTVRLPLAASRFTASAPTNRRPALARRKRRRILVADDNTDAAVAIAELLRLEGHRVETAKDGATALNIAEALQPDVAFIDLNMPVMDGYELARHLRIRSRRPKLVAVTGMGQALDLERTRAAGFDLHLTKPADPGLILSVATEENNIDKVQAHASAGASCVEIDALEY